ncbi:inositol 2-dehydrogenase [Janthinobacterium sp. MP5059B]|nr:inositol 2-dehydrogenase [Janthinobacterium sp. MP5059B]
MQFKYVVDVNQEAAAALAGLHGGSSASVETALADPAIKAVVIASSTDTHADLILRSAAAGKAIFCEKPVDLTIDRARACAAAVKEAKVLCMLGFQRRYDPTFNAVKTRIEAGEIGTPELLVVTSRDPGPPPVSYIKVSGGIFKDMLIHDFDIFRWILDDEAVSVHATGSCLVDPAIGEAGDLDTAVVTIRTAKGRLCQINASRRAAYGYDQRFEVLGSAGMLQAGNHKPTEVTAYGSVNVSVDKPEDFFLERYRVAYAQEMAHFFDALTHGTPLRTTVHDGLKALELAEAATLSWREQRVVTL